MRSSTRAFPDEAPVTRTALAPMIRGASSTSLRLTEFVVKTLLEERFAPVTSSVGFLEVPFSEAVDGLAEWRRSLYPTVTSRPVVGGFPEVLRNLEPLTSGARPRELLVDHGSWTAYFDNSLQGTDAVSAIGVLSRRLKCRGLAVEAVPHTIGLPGVKKGRAGAVQFTLFGPIKTGFLNYVRTVSVLFDGSRWVFNANGTEQAFEQVESYAARRVRDRFTSEMLERYCQELGVNVFDAAGYGRDAVLVESEVTMPKNGAVMTLREAQEWLEVDPGQSQSALTP